MNARTNQSPSAQAQSHHAAGMKLVAAGRIVEAAKHFEAAARLEPRNPVWHFNCGLAWQQLERVSEAIASYRKAIVLDPNFFDAWNNLAAACKSAGDVEAAVAAGQKAVTLSPQTGAAHLNLGNALKARGDLTGAESAYRQALEHEPANPKTQVNLANTLREAGRLAEAIALLRQIIARHPHFAEAHRDLAFALLLSGDLAAGWSENEWRWETEEMRPKRRTFDGPIWRGENLAGRRLLIYTEQGFGDALQFVRLAAAVAERGGPIILECQPALRRLFERAPGIHQLVVRGEPLPHFDFHIPLLSLPGVLGIELGTIPNRVPYLAVPPEAAQSLSEKAVLGSTGYQPVPSGNLPDGTVEASMNNPGVAFVATPTAVPVGRLPTEAGRLPAPPVYQTCFQAISATSDLRLKAGLVWAGNPEHQNDRGRSLPFAALRPLFDLERISFFGLQVGARTVDLSGAPGPAAIHDLSPMLTDFAATAAAIARLDLVISVDTAVAHLAGALAKPVWVLIPYAPDWRWLLGRDDSPWYPTARLFRQPRPGDWTSVIRNVRDQLESAAG